MNSLPICDADIEEDEGMNYKKANKRNNGKVDTQVNFLTELLISTKISPTF